MKVENIRIVTLRSSERVADAFVGRGLLRGGHSALPDIDVDYASDRRQEIKEYLEERYDTEGQHRVFSAGTFTTLRLKAAIRDAARVYGVSAAEVNRITPLLDDALQWEDLFRLAVTNPRLRDFILRYPELIEDIRGILGQPKAASIHASAIVVTPRTRDGVPVECFDFLPLRRMDGILVSEFDGYAVDEIGLLKEDVLATKELAKLSDIIALVNEKFGTALSIEVITSRHLDDAKTYRLLSEGYTQHIFQFSSKGITRFLQEVRPACIEDLIAVNALYRPATLDIGATEDYIRYRRGDAVPVYDFGCYEATKNTYGILCYQEQFMSIAHTLGGFDAGKTDLLRKAIGKKDAELMASLKADFIAGALRNGCPREEAYDIWQKIQTAGRYSFNRSHAAAYALTAYCGAWLKANYPSAFYTVALQWADDREVFALMSEMQRQGAAKILPPDINRSQKSFYTDFATQRIFWSLLRIRHMGVKAAEHILAERNSNGPFAGIEDFLRRIFRHRFLHPGARKAAQRVPVTAQHVRNLILAGCFDRPEGIEHPAARYAALRRADRLLGGVLRQLPQEGELLKKDYFWAQQQIAVSGIGVIDYERIYEESGVRELLRRKASYASLRDILPEEAEGRRVVVCATVAEVAECVYTNRETSRKRHFAKLLLQQNNDTAYCIVWNDIFAARRTEILALEGRVAIISATVHYSDYDAANQLQAARTSLLKPV